MLKFKPAIFAVIIPLAAFIASGAALLSDDASNVTRKTSQDNVVTSLYQNPFAEYPQNLQNHDKNQAESGHGHTGLVLWLLGMPLGILGGLAIGLSLRIQRSTKTSLGRHQVRYIILSPSQKEEPLNADSKSPIHATYRDSLGIATIQHSRNSKNCQLRFRSATVSNRRENQPL